MTDRKRVLVSSIRWLHIYLSMFSFSVLLFFAFTGITLNHTSWLEGEQQSDLVKGQLPVEWLNGPTGNINELLIVENLRTQYRIQAPLTSFTTDDSECAISFKGPGFTADGFVDRATGSFEMTITRSGLIAMMNDLHKGRDTGRTWSAFIDVSSVLMILVSLTGFMMIFFLKKRLVGGLLIALAGLVLTVVIYYAFV